MPKTEPNHRLAEAIQASGLTHKALARAVCALVSGTRYDHTSVSRWIAGVIPRAEVRQGILTVLREHTQRPLTLADLGFAGKESLDPRTGLAYPTAFDEAVTATQTLWLADLTGDRTIVDASADLGTWSAATLSWLVRPDQPPHRERQAGDRVGETDIKALRTTVEAFSALDSMFGGAHGRRALIQYLNTDVKTMLAGTYTDATGQELFTATAESLLLAAWMSYDAGMHGLAQRYFVQALWFADNADKILLAGSILDAMSHQATFLGDHREAVNLARAARNGTRGIATATLTAHFHAMEARALGAAADRVGAEKALSLAVTEFERRKPGVDPDWISYVDDAELAAEFAHTYRDLRRGTEAISYAGKAVTGGSARSDFFVTMVSAVGHLQTKVINLESSCAALDTALELGRQVKSARCVQYLREFRRDLHPYRTDPIVRALDEMYADHPLWIASA
jgi:hypothetical protein